MAVDRNYGVPDFPIVSNPFDNPHSPKTFSTELENTDTFNVEDIFELGFLRSNPDKKVYQHKDKPILFLEELFEFDYSVKDRIVRRIVIFEKISLPTFSKILYNSTKPNKEDIQLIIDTF